MVPELRKHVFALEARRLDHPFEPDYFTLDQVQQPPAETHNSPEKTPSTATPQVNVMPPTPVKLATMSLSTTSTPMMKEVIFEEIQVASKKRRRLSDISDAADVQSLTATPPSPKEPRRKPALPKQTSELRRSTRARAKVVNYAESASSEASTEDAYPERSKADSFSPPKSDLTASPAKIDTPPRRRSTTRQRRDNAPARPSLLRSSSSLGRLIEDWKSRTPLAPATPPQGVRSGVLHFPNGQTVGKHYSPSYEFRPPLNGITPSQTNVNPFRKSESMHNARVSAGSRGTSLDSPYHHTNPYDLSQSNGLQTLPSFSSIDPYESNQSQHSRGPNLYNAYASKSMSSASRGNYIQQPIIASQRDTNPKQDWLINTPAFQNTASPPHPAARDHLQRSFAPPRHEPFDSTTTSFSMRPQAMQAYQQHLNYSRIRHDFDTPLDPDLTPPEINSTFDPHKRRAPASSPLPAAKRVRPSLSSGDFEAADEARHARQWDSDSAVILPSPPKVPKQVDVAGWSHGQHYGEGEGYQASPPRVPAAGFAPTAVMDAPSLGRTTSFEFEF
ncbi:hypothetical protein BDY17DRAFT_298239 [Neohortaea acidophila]|uniref:Uncharacterized protein n=1 Tax=Neohortaea acidophila TaxID=245834 RepID=A0A6A6PQ83_9PEZI|nr:uncharacterized protein BDY17DRAFT_298239 [Neohortaea acidophila]KAF2482270.1 hypothetical protein BDY17DRAFT_298239 [Neohortaea acidophila]